MINFRSVAPATALVAAGALFGTIAATDAFAGHHAKKGDGKDMDRVQKLNDVERDGLSTDPADVQSGKYTIDSTHVNVTWQVSHLGFSLYQGRFNEIEGTLDLDTANIENSKLSVTIQTASIDTVSDKLDDELRAPEAFGAEEFPTITFTSTKIERKDDNWAKVTGNLTARGVTKPVTLKVRFLGTGQHPFNGKPTVGFHAQGHIMRSDFGIGKDARWSPVIGDSVGLIIDAEFNAAE